MKREKYFLGIVIVVGVFILFKTVRLQWDEGTIALTITVQKGAIVTLDTPRTPSDTKEMLVQEINFEQGRMLENRQYGKMGYTSNFFLDARVDMNVAQSGMYRFTVGSDDGFRLEIDGKTLCEHPGDRPWQITSCNIDLTKGSHTYALHYFQGGGPMGLQAGYGLNGSEQRYIIGDDSKLITFKKMQ